MTSSEQEARPMLEGVRIVDLTSVVFGPYATQTLADLGADVIKVESPEAGDFYRWSAKAARTPGMSPGYMSLNRGKRSIALDLKKPDDLQVIHELLKDADVFILNVRGKAVERLGLDFESVKAINPEIIYVHCVGFGQDGPYADLQAYDDVIQAASGTASLLSRVDGDPRARYLPSLIADKVAGLHAAYAVLAAIVHKLKTGRGQKVEVPMLETFTHFMMVEHLAGKTFDPPNAPAGYSRQLDPDRQPFPTKNGYISIVPYTDDSWARVFKLLEAPEFLDDPRFETRKLRAENMADMYRQIGRLKPNFTTEELVVRCKASDIPAQPVRDLEDVTEDPHLQAVGFFRRREHPTEGGVLDMRPPVRFSDFAPEPGRLAPNLGQHSAEVRSGLRRDGAA